MAKKTKRKDVKKKSKQKLPLKMSLKVSEKRYQELVSMKKSKKKMSLKDKKSLDSALYAKYCMCLQKLERGDANPYPICMNSVYLNRGFKPPKNASRNCNVVFNKKK